VWNGTGPWLRSALMSKHSTSRRVQATQTMNGCRWASEQAVIGKEFLQARPMTRYKASNLQRSVGSVRTLYRFKALHDTLHVIGLAIPSNIVSDGINMYDRVAYWMRMLTRSTDTNSTTVWKIVIKTDRQRGRKSRLTSKFSKNSVSWWPVLSHTLDELIL